MFFQELISLIFINKNAWPLHVEELHEFLETSWKLGITIEELRKSILSNNFFWKLFYLPKAPSSSIPKTPAAHASTV